MTAPDDGMRIEVTVIGPPGHRRIALFVAPDSYLVVKGRHARRVAEMLADVAATVDDD